jgi:hypothetical protein
MSNTSDGWKRVTHEKRRPGTFHIHQAVFYWVNYTSIVIPDRTIFQYDTIYPNRLYYTQDGVIWVSGNRHFHLTNCMRTGDYLFSRLDPYVHNRNGHLLMRKITKLELTFK